MKKVKAPPGARRLIESLRSLGYECSTAIADLVDNSITAQASEVYVDIYGQDGARPPHVVIADNGHGMSREELHEAMRFGAFQEYSSDDLGKYGLGLKTASLSQCRILTVASKAKAEKNTKPRRLLMRWDLDDVYRSDDWDLLAPTADELPAWEQEAIANPLARQHGTVVLWSGLEEPLLSSDDVRARERFLARLIDDVSEHLRMVFHRFMEGSLTGRKKLHISVCGSRLEPWDPFCRDQSTRELDILRQKVDWRNRSGDALAGDVTLSPFVLPREDEFTNAHRWKAAAGPRNWNQQQGFYFYRNNRLLQAGGWSWLRAVDEHTKLLRVAVHFTGELDQAFQLNVTKMRALIPAEIRESVSAAVSKWAKTARERYDRRPAQPRNGGSAHTPAPKEPARKPDAPPYLNIGKLSLSLSNAPTESLAVVRGSQAGTVRIMIPQNHELAVAFNGKGSASDRELKRLCAAALAVLESVHERRLKPDDIPIVSLRRALKRAL